MPAGASPKRERQYKHIKQSAKKSGRYGGRAEEVAARTVNKIRREKGETKSQRSKKGRSTASRSRSTKSRSTRSRAGSRKSTSRSRRTTSRSRSGASRSRPRASAARRTAARRRPSAPRTSSRRRGFAGMSDQRQRAIAAEGGRAAHQQGTAHEFSSSEAREAGQKGGETVSRDRSHMAQIGRRGGEH